MTTEYHKQNYNPIRANYWIYLLLIGIGIVVVTWIIIALDLDRRIATWFYDPSLGWYLAKKQPWSWLYHYGTIPGIVLGLAALAGWFWSYSSNRFRTLHRYLLVIVLTAILGPGVLVNGILKNYWSRPRPREVQEFGGTWIYRHAHQPGIPGKGESFPCGHCTMGFLFCSLMVFRKHHRWLAYTGAAVGISLGTLLSIARMVQGAHYLSDTLWSMGILLILPLVLYGFICHQTPDSAPEPKTLSPNKKILLWVAFVLCLILMLGSFLLHRPFYKDHVSRIKIPQQINRVLLQVNTEIQSSTVRFLDIDAPQLVVTGRGFAWIGAKHKLRRHLEVIDTKLVLDLKIEKSGYFSELTHELVIQMPKDLQDSVDFEIVDTSINKVLQD
jgi:membrane-associated PAP2 superfamily phosphatase